MRKITTMKCFEEQIGIYGCHNKEEKRLYVNDISGISNELLEHITDGERSTYKQVYKKALKGAVNTLKFDIEATMLSNKEKHEFGNVLYESEEARIVMPIEYSYIGADSVGVMVFLPSSKYVVANVLSMSLYPRDNITVVPFVRDLEAGIDEDGEEIDLRGGEINVLDYEYSISADKSRGVYFGIRLESELWLGKMSCNRFVKRDCESVCEVICDDGQTEDFKGTLESVLADERDEFGIYVAVEQDNEIIEAEDVACANLKLKCSMDEFVCKHSEELADALVYLVAYNILTEKLSSTRQNMWAKGNLEVTAMRRDEVKATYDKMIKVIVPKIRLTGTSLCWDCVQSGIYLDTIV